MAQATLPGRRKAKAGAIAPDCSGSGQVPATMGANFRCRVPNQKRSATAPVAAYDRAGGCGLFAGLVSCFDIRVISPPPTSGCSAASSASAFSLAYTSSPST